MLLQNLPGHFIRNESTLFVKLLSYFVFIAAKADHRGNSTMIKVEDKSNYDIANNKECTENYSFFLFLFLYQFHV